MLSEHDAAYSIYSELNKFVVVANVCVCDLATLRSSALGIEMGKVGVTLLVRATKNTVFTKILITVANDML